MIQNFAWIATWKITRRCNLYCVYCDHASMRKASHKEDIDYKKVIENLRGYSPKIVNISGGEPTLVEQLPWVLSEMKKQWNPFIRVVHNGTNPEKILPCLPFMDRLVISMDGPDPINKNNRGISAESVLNKLKEVLPQVFAHKVEVMINCVLTTANLGTMKEFLRMVQAVSPDIGVSFTPIIPPDDKLSVLSKESDFNRFLASFNELKSQGYFVAHAFDGIMRHENYKHIKCYNQYFILRLTPEGQIVTCAMNTKMSGDHYKYYFRKLFSKKGLSKGLNRIMKKARQNVFNSIDFSCNTICACENWLDLIFLGIQSDSLAGYARGLYGRMTQEDYDKAEAFVRKHINPGFNGSALKAIVDASCQSTQR
jgi:MoaA/NifB/PqqE/SkfB family radical SAM enzyme